MVLKLTDSLKKGIDHELAIVKQRGKKLVEKKKITLRVLCEEERGNNITSYLIGTYEALVNHEILGIKSINKNTNNITEEYYFPHPETAYEKIRSLFHPFDYWAIKTLYKNYHESTNRVLKKSKQ